MINEAPFTAESLECLQAINIVGSSLKNLFMSPKLKTFNPPGLC